MKKFGLKFKINLWYTAFMVILLSTTLYIIYSMSAYSLMNKTDDQLLETINKAKNYIQYEDGIFKFDDNLLEIDDLVSIIIYDQYGNVLKGAAPRLFSIDTPFSSGLGSIELGNNNRYLYRDVDYIVNTAPLKLVIRAISTYTNVNLTLQYFLIASFILGPIGILIAVIGGNLLMKSIFRPIEEINETAKKISEDTDLSLRILDYSQSDELDNLVITINLMLDRLEQAFKREKQFTDDISHELRSPLTSMLLDIEMLEVSGIYNEETVKRLHKQTIWMANLIESMSLSTQSLKTLKNDTINLKEFLNLISDEYQEEIKIVVARDIFIKTDEMLLRRILINLLNNSFQYKSSLVTISLVDKNKLIIEDNGKGIKKSDLNFIFDRFYQEDKSRNISDSSGLGLYFVKQAIDALGYQISVESEVNSFTRFIITITL